jgi:hypothetical protein
MSAAVGHWLHPVSVGLHCQAAPPPLAGRHAQIAPATLPYWQEKQEPASVSHEGPMVGPMTCGQAGQLPYAPPQYQIPLLSTHWPGVLLGEPELVLLHPKRAPISKAAQRARSCLSNDRPNDFRAEGGRSIASADGDKGTTPSATPWSNRRSQRSRIRDVTQALLCSRRAALPTRRGPLSERVIRGSGWQRRGPSTLTRRSQTM